MKKSTAVIIPVLVCVVIAVYSNGLLSGFVWDDEGLIVQRSRLFSNPGNILTILSSSDAGLYVRANPYYRPVTGLSYFMDYHLWGLKPFWYHLENVLLHALVVALLYVLVAKAFGDVTLAFIVALLFAVHPVNAEAVDFISARNNILCAALMAGSLLCVQSRTVAGALCGLAAYFLALLSKEPAVVMPFFLLSLTFFGRQEKYRTGKVLLGGYFAVTVVYFLLRAWVLGVLTTEAGAEFSLERFRVVASALFENLRLMVFPVKLNALYTSGWIVFQPYKAAVAVVGAGLLCYCAVRRGIAGPVRAGSLWMLWGFLPISNVVLIPSAPVAERYVYIPLMGFALITGYGLYWLYRKRAAWGVALVLALTLTLGMRTFVRNFDWKDNMSLYGSMVSSDPANPAAHYNLALEYMGAGRNALAFQHLGETLRLDPEDAEAHNNLGVVYDRLALLAEAMSEFQIAIKLKPDLPDAHNNLGVLYDRMGRYDEAIREFRNALRLLPDYVSAHNNLGLLYGELGRFEDEIKEYQTALTYRYNSPEVHKNLGISYRQLGRYDEAIREFGIALMLNPNNAETLNELETARSLKGNERSQSGLP